MLKFILIPIILLSQAGIAYYVVFNVLLKNPEAEAKPKARQETMQVGQFFEVNDIIVNPANSGGRRYLVLELGLETNTPEVIEEATIKEIWIRDAIITLLTNKTAEELMEITARKKLKKEILATINRKLIKGKFERIYFKKYIVQ